MFFNFFYWFAVLIMVILTIRPGIVVLFGEPTNDAGIIGQVLAQGIVVFGWLAVAVSGKILFG